MTTADITADSTMQEVLDAYPGAQRALMRGYHIGGCSSCGFSPEERLADVLARKDVHTVGEVIDFIKQSHEQEQRIQMRPEELAEALRGDNPPKVIDVRQVDEHEVCMIDGALPATQELVQEIMTSWPKDTPIVTVCHRGLRSLDAASYLIGHGYTNVRSLHGGVDLWAERIEPSMARY